MNTSENLTHGPAARSVYGRTLCMLGLIGLVLLFGGGQRAGAQKVFFPGTGHYYEAVTATLTWASARDDAAFRTYLGKHGHLVTITSAAEQNFITSTFPQAFTTSWIGAYQDTTAPDYSEPAGGFRWVTGEPMTYTAWAPGEPDNGGNTGVAQNYVILGANGLWDDFGTATALASGYIIEFDFPRPTFDVNGDGYGDILLQNSVTGQVSYWFMQGINQTGTATTATLPAAGWALRGTGDFNGDGHPDLVFQNTTTGQIGVWYMNGTTVLGAESLSYYPAARYQLAGVGDFNGDGHPDLVFQNTTTGQIAIWYLNGVRLIGYDSTNVVPGAGYMVVGTGDFNGDGQTDLVFQNSSTGVIVFWYMNGAQFMSGDVASVQPYANYKVVGVNDYNNDGRPDLLFQNTVTGLLSIWYMRGPVWIGGGEIGPVPSANNVAVGPR